MIISFFVSIALAAPVEGTYPDKRLTPGATREVSMAVICKVGSTKDVRHVTATMKREVFHRYGFVEGKYKPGDYEIDHFISLELGGDNDIENLWPEAYCPVGNKPLKTGCFGAREKDRVETSLHRQICNGSISIEQAQKIIRTDWVQEYKKENSN